MNADRKTVKKKEHEMRVEITKATEELRGELSTEHEREITLTLREARVEWEQGRMLEMQQTSRDSTEKFQQTLKEQHLRMTASNAKALEELKQTMVPMVEEIAHMLY